MMPEQLGQPGQLELVPLAQLAEAVAVAWH